MSFSFQTVRDANKLVSFNFHGTGKHKFLMEIVIGLLFVKVYQLEILKFLLVKVIKYIFLVCEILYIYCQFTKNNHLYQVQ